MVAEIETELSFYESCEGKSFTYLHELQAPTVKSLS